ncbi:hypothetical protein DERF_012968 [Dermatophagoides farinae]|uniref:Uncharacterized protein n=1 Tax=Dermatophagoides farinae TaxID=6954 RepID=A0A922HL02_DERFA|nr:hypothetical protein DERF_012968 [Dermatophagoides farinae]
MRGLHRLFSPFFSGNLIAKFEKYDFLTQDSLIEIPRDWHEEKTHEIMILALIDFLKCSSLS